MLSGAAQLNRLRGNNGSALRYSEEGLRLARAADDKKNAALSLQRLGFLKLDDGKIAEAEPLFEEGLRFAHELGDRQVLGMLYNALGESLRLQNDLDRAADHYAAALDYNREAGDRVRQTTNLINLGATALLQRDFEKASAYYREGLEVGSKMADMNGTLYCLEGMAGAFFAGHDPETAALIYGAAEAVRKANSLFLEPADRPPYDQSVARVRESLTETVFDEVHAEGSRMKLEDTVALAIARSGSGRLETTVESSRAAAAAPGQVEPSGNVLKLVDREEGALEVVPQHPLPAKKGSRWSAMKVSAAIAVVLVVIGALLYLRGRFLTNGTPATPVRTELTILRLTNGAAPIDATISPNGDYFVYHEQDGETAHLWLQQTGQSKRVEIIPPVAEQIGPKTFSPDGSFVYFLAFKPGDEPSLYRVPTLGGTARKVLTGIDSPVSFSPDGARIVFRRTNRETRETSILITDALGNAERVLFAWNRDRGVLGASAWSPDGKTIAYTEWTSDGVTINGIDLNTGRIERLSPEKWGNCYRLEWLRDGSGLVFVGTKSGEGYSTRRDQIYYLELATGEARRLTTDGNRHQIDSLGITDRDEIVGVPMNRSSQIWEMSPTGDASTAVQITKGAADGRAGLTALADGRIGYIARIGDSIGVWTADADGGNQMQLTYEPIIAEEVRAPANGSFLVFSAPQDGLNQLFRIDADGSNLRQLTFGDMSNVDSTVSPDGNWIAYTSQVARGEDTEHSLKRIPAAGGEPTTLTGLVCDAPHYSPDGKFISCVTAEGKFSVVSAEDGSAVASFQPVQTPYVNCGAKWSPDGRDLIYIARRRDS